MSLISLFAVSADASVKLKPAPDVQAFAVFASKPGKKLVLPSEVQHVDKELGGYLSHLATDESFEGKEGQVLLHATNGIGGAKRLLLVGAGDRKTFTLESLRRLTGTLTHVASRVAGISALFTIPFDALPAKVTAEEIGEAVAVGAEGAAYRFLKYKKEQQAKDEKRRLKKLYLPVDARQRAALQRGFERGCIQMEAVSLVRDIVNEPASVMTPRGFKKEAERVAKLPGVTMRAYDNAALGKMGAGAHLAVAKGSDEPAYLLHLSYVPTKGKARKKIALVGKGITFDSGGLSLKPANYMEDMKTDVAGAATVLATLKACAELSLPVEVHALCALAENMPSGRAMRPGDVVTAINGKTIEILNTDAEGRLVLADALSYTGKEVKPDLIIDVATLTGAAMVAFGVAMAPYMGADKTLLEQFKQAGHTSGEAWWEIPLVAEYTKQIEGTVSDLKNITKSPFAGTITAGLFLQAFVPEGTPWVHCDIAGPAFTSEALRTYMPSGGTGFALRTLLALLESYC